jgi:hypothetical protein
LQLPFDNSETAFFQNKGYLMSTLTTNQLIKSLTSAILGPSPSARQRFLIEQSLMTLVRLAKSEHRIEMKRNADTAAKAVKSAVSKSVARATIQKASFVFQGEFQERRIL